MDRTDIKLLALLRKNARLSNKELASDVGLAESTCLERVRRLRQDGVLIGARSRNVKTIRLTSLLIFDFWR